MTEPTQSFTASTTEDAEAPPIPFSLDGVYAKGRSGPKGETTWHEDYELSATPPAAAAGVWGQAFIEDSDGNQQLNPAAVIEFLYEVLTPDSSQRFRALVNDPNRIVRLETLGKVFAWASDEVLNRPT